MPKAREMLEFLDSMNTANDLNLSNTASCDYPNAISHLTP